MAECTSFDVWAKDCPMKDRGRCISKNDKACRRYRCPRIDVFKGWRINEKERMKPKKWWK